jgi:polygalacturonase
LNVAEGIADASGKLLATKAIQSAIDRAPQSGGGAVLVPPGLYRVQSLSLKSNVTLYVSGGAVAPQGALPARSTDNASPAHSMMNIPRVIYIPDLDSIRKSLTGLSSGS